MKRTAFLVVSDEQTLGDDQKHLARVIFSHGEKPFLQESEMAAQPESVVGTITEYDDNDESIGEGLPAATFKLVDEQGRPHVFKLYSNIVGDRYAKLKEIAKRAYGNRRNVRVESEPYLNNARKATDIEELSDHALQTPVA